MAALKDRAARAAEVDLHQATFAIGNTRLSADLNCADGRLERRCKTCYRVIAVLQVDPREAARHDYQAENGTGWTGAYP